MLRLLPQPPHTGCALRGRRFRTVAPSDAVWSTVSRYRCSPARSNHSARCIRVRAADVAESPATSEAPAEAAAGTGGSATRNQQSAKRQRNVSLVPKIDPTILQEGTELEGVVRSVATYGAFLDIGLPTREGKKDTALLHVSQMQEQFTADANQVAKAGDKLTVWVLTVEEGTGNVRLTLKPPGTTWNKGGPGKSSSSAPASPRPSVPKIDLSQLSPEDFTDGVVISLQTFGAFLDIGAERDALLHVSQLKGHASELSELSVGKQLRVRVSERQTGKDGQMRIGVTTFAPGEEPSQPQKQSAGRRASKYQYEDIVAGQEYEGKVVNVSDIGAFIDIGAPRDALLRQAHQLPGEDYSPGTALTVRVLFAYPDSGKIGVTRLPEGEADSRRPPRGGGAGGPRGDRGPGGRRERTPPEPTGIKAGEELTTTVVDQMPYGVRLQIREGLTCLLHRNEFATTGKELDPKMDFPLESEVKVRVLDVDESKRRVNVTQKSDEDRELDAVFNSGKGMSTEEEKVGKKGKGAQASAGGSALAAALFGAGLQLPTQKAGSAPSVNGKAASPAAEPEPAEQETMKAASVPEPTTEPVSAPEDAPEPAPVPEPQAAAAEPEPEPESLPEPEAEPEAAAPTPAAEQQAPAAAEEPAAEAEKKLGDAEPVDPAPLVEDVHKNLEPDVKQGEAASASTSEPAEAQAESKLGDAERIDPAPIVDQVHEKLEADLTTEPLTSLSPEGPPPAKEDSSPPANTAVLNDDGTVGEKYQEPQAKPSPALDLQGEAPPSPVSPPATPAAEPVAAEAPSASQPVAKEEAKPEDSEPLPAAIEQSSRISEEKAPTPPETSAPAAPEASPVAPPQQNETASAPSSNGASIPEPSSNGKAGKVSAAAVQELRRSSGAGMMDCKKALTECQGDVEKAADYLRKKGLASAGKRAGRIASEGVIASYIHAGNRLGVLLEVNCESDFVARSAEFTELVENLSMQAAASFDAKYVSLDDVDPSVRERETEVQMGAEDLQNKPEKIRPQIVKGRVDKVLNGMTLLEIPYVRDPSKTVDTLVKEMSAKLGEKISIRRFVRYTLGEGLEKKEENLSAEVAKQQAAMAEKAAEQAKKEAEALPEPDMSANIKVDPKAVKSLRESSGAGMMDCKKALVACENNAEKAADWLRKKGLAQAGKKAGRATSEGALWSYIHNGERLGVMVEVNCETDFVAKNDKFLELCEDLSMQIAACDATVVSVEDVPKEVLDKEREIELQKEDLASKPEAIREKIVQGRVDKIAKQQALLECAFVRDTNKTVRQYIQEAIAALGENIQVRRFVRYNLGEGLEKKSQDFAAEVAAQTQAAAA